MPAPANQPTLDTEPKKLAYVMEQWADFTPPFTTTPAGRALADEGVTGLDDLLMLSEEDIDQLKDPGVPATAGVAEIPAAPLSLRDRRMIKCVIAYYHDSCKAVKRQIRLVMHDRNMFDDFRVDSYDPHSKIVPWRVQLAKATNGTDPNADALVNWQKSVKPNKSDYKEFRDEHFWNKAKENFEDTLEAHGLSHLIDETFTVVNKDLHESQQKWLYNVLTGIMLAPQARLIVKGHKADKNVCEIWKEICAAYDDSMSAELRSQKISGYLTTIRLHQSNWKGTQSNFIFHWADQSRIYNEISLQPYTDDQLISFLSAAVAGTPNLSTVLSTNKAARRAAKNNDKLRFSEYCELLTEAAQVHDGARSSINPRPRRQVNQHEFDGYVEEQAPTEYSVDYHDMDTPIELIVNQHQQAPANRRQPVQDSARMDGATWHSLSDAEKKAWDTMSDATKKAIFAYGAKNVTRFAQQAKQQGTSPRQANSHEQEPSKDSSKPNEGVTEVSTHEIDHTKQSSPILKNPTPIVPNQGSLLSMATKRTTFEEAAANKQITVNSILSVPSKSKTKPKTGQKTEISAHEIFQSRSPYTPEHYSGHFEINSHEINFDGDDERPMTWEERVIQAEGGTSPEPEMPYWMRAAIAAEKAYDEAQEAQLPSLEEIVDQKDGPPMPNLETIVDDQRVDERTMTTSSVRNPTPPPIRNPESPRRTTAPHHAGSHPKSSLRRPKHSGAYWADTFYGKKPPQPPRDLLDSSSSGHDDTSITFADQAKTYHYEQDMISFGDDVSTPDIKLTDVKPPSDKPSTERVRRTPEELRQEIIRREREYDEAERLRKEEAARASTPETTEEPPEMMQGRFSSVQKPRKLKNKLDEVRYEKIKNDLQQKELAVMKEVESQQRVIMNPPPKEDKMSLLDKAGSMITYAAGKVTYLSALAPTRVTAESVQQALTPVPAPTSTEEAVILAEATYDKMEAMKQAVQSGAPLDTPRDITQDMSSLTLVDEQKPHGTGPLKKEDSVPNLTPGSLLERDDSVPSLIAGRAQRESDSEEEFYDVPLNRSAPRANQGSILSDSAAVQQDQWHEHVDRKKDKKKKARNRRRRRSKQKGEPPNVITRGLCAILSPAKYQQEASSSSNSNSASSSPSSQSSTQATQRGETSQKKQDFGKAEPR